MKNCRSFILAFLVTASIIISFLYIFGSKKILTYFDPVLGGEYVEYYWLGTKIDDHEITQNSYKSFILDNKIFYVFPFPMLVTEAERIWLTRRWEYKNKNISNIPLLIYQSLLSKKEKIKILQNYQKDIWQSFVSNQDFREVITLYQEEVTTLQEGISENHKNSVSS